MSSDSSSFYNRYKKKITIERTSPLEFKISGFDSDFMRIGKNGDEITMMDPSGGPMITSTKYMSDRIEGIEGWASNMKEFKPEWQDLVVEKIEFSEDCSAILSCKYIKEISWVKVK
jgi:hypothetical protein